MFFWLLIFKHIFKGVFFTVQEINFLNVYRTLGAPDQFHAKRVVYVSKKSNHSPPKPEIE